MAVPIFDIRPMSVGDILDRTLRLYRRHFLHTLGIAAVPYVLLLPATVGLGFVSGSGLTWQTLQDPMAVAGWSVLGLAAIWLVFVSMGALARSISERYLGGTPDIWASYRAVLRRGFSLLWAYFLSFLVWGGVLAAGVALPLLVSTFIVVMSPGPWGLGIYALSAVFVVTAVVAVVMAFFRLLLVTQVIVIEDLRGPAALQRSWTLMRRNAWRAVVIFLFGITVSFIVDFLFGLALWMAAGLHPALGAEVVETFVDYIARALTTPLLSIPFTLLYYDSRIRTEGFDLEMMAQNLGGAPSPPSPAPAASPSPEPTATPSRGPVGTVKTCPACGATVPPIRPTCPRCGEKVPFRSQG